MSNANKTHHTAEGFCNNYPSAAHGSFWKWQRERWANGVPKIPKGGYRFELLRPDVGWLRHNRTEPTLTWVGHATFLLQLNGLNILTDAHFSERASPVQFAGPQRVVPPALRLSELPHIDAVVISHNHYDHLDRATVKRVAAQPGGSAHFFVPLGLKAWLAGIGIREATQLDWWEDAEHWGTFILTDEPLDEPPQRLAAARRAAGISPETFFVMKHGETRKLAGMLNHPQQRAQETGAVS